MGAERRGTSSAAAEFAQQLDEALANYRPARSALTDAMARWAGAVEELAGANGSAREAEESAVPGGLVLAATEDPDRGAAA